MPRYENENCVDRSHESFSDANSFGPLLHAEGEQTPEAKARNENCHSSKKLEERVESYLTLVISINMIVQEPELKYTVRTCLFPDVFQGFNGFWNVTSRLDLYAGYFVKIWILGHDQWINASLKRHEIEICDDTGNFGLTA